MFTVRTYKYVSLSTYYTHIVRCALTVYGMHRNDGKAFAVENAHGITMLTHSYCSLCAGGLPTTSVENAYLMFGEKL